MNSRCKTKYYKIRAGGFLDVTPECKLTSLDILRTHVKLLATELRGKTIKESIGLTNHTFQKIQEIFLGILTRWNLFQDVKLFGFIQWDEAHIYVVKIQSNIIPRENQVVILVVLIEK